MVWVGSDAGEGDCEAGLAVIFYVKSIFEFCLESVSNLASTSAPIMTSDENSARISGQ